MAIPMNATGFIRLQDLAAAMYEANQKTLTTTKADLDIYIGDPDAEDGLVYVNITVRGFLSPKAIRDIYEY